MMQKLILDLKVGVIETGMVNSYKLQNYEHIKKNK